MGSTPTLATDNNEYINPCGGMVYTLASEASPSGCGFDSHQGYKHTLVLELGRQSWLRAKSEIQVGCGFESHREYFCFASCLNHVTNCYNWNKRMLYGYYGIAQMPITMPGGRVGLRRQILALIGVISSSQVRILPR